MWWSFPLKTLGGAIGCRLGSPDSGDFRRVTPITAGSLRPAQDVRVGDSGGTDMIDTGEIETAQRMWETARRALNPDPSYGIFRDGQLYVVLAGSDNDAANATSEWANDFPVMEWTFRRM